MRTGLERYGPVFTPDLPRGDLETMAAAARIGVPKPAILVGHSIGGIVALRAAALDPAAVAGLVLTDSFFPPARNGRSRAAALADYGSHRVALVREMAASGARPRPRGDAARGMRALARLGLRPGELHATADRVRAPVMVIHARDDHHVPVDFAVAAAARHPSWTLALLERGGHNAHVERPAEWLAAAVPWLEGISAAGG